jgi:hypothetical protein
VEKKRKTNQKPTKNKNRAKLQNKKIETQKILTATNTK